MWRDQGHILAFSKTQLRIIHGLSRMHFGLAPIPFFAWYQNLVFLTTQNACLGQECILKILWNFIFSVISMHVMKFVYL